MAETTHRPAAKTRRPAATKEATTREPPAGRRRHEARVERHEARIGRHGARIERRDARIERRTELSEDVLKSLDEGARSAIDAVRKFTETVDRALPPRGEGPSRGQEIIDSALEMAQRLVHTQAEFMRKVVDSTGKALTRSKDAK
ncbi:MAG TPA: hypothetical protein VKG38_04260 [Solirubrobacteraceae bacterium]|nr:hypothetical protein [Solirubrobacteraceae bacterium]